jgi:hypothetical protein
MIRTSVSAIDGFELTNVVYFYCLLDCACAECVREKTMIELSVGGPLPEAGALELETYQPYFSALTLLFSI